MKARLGSDCPLQRVQHRAMRRGRTAAPAEVGQKPLNDAELYRIPVTTRDDPSGLTRAAKETYRAMRRFARGGDEAYPRAQKLENAIDYSPDTRRRALAELVEKDYVEKTDRFMGRARVYLLRRGQSELAEVYRLRPTPAVVEPQNATLEPQNAAHIEKLRTEESGLRPLSLRSEEEAAASPRLATAGKGAARRKTGWRECRGTHGISYVLDPEGTDKRPSRYAAPIGRRVEVDPVELPDLEPDEVRRRVAEKWRRHFALGDAALPPEAPAATGSCDDCHSDAQLLRLGSFEVCAACAARRQAAAIAVASQVTVAEDSRDELLQGEHDRAASFVMPDNFASAEGAT